MATFHTYIDVVGSILSRFKPHGIYYAYALRYVVSNDNTSIHYS